MHILYRCSIQTGKWKSQSQNLPWNKNSKWLSERNYPVQNTIIYDVSALLWVNWPLDKLHVYVDALKKFVFQALQMANVTLVFDRYFPNSIKTFARAGSSRAHKLTPDMPAPAEEQVLTKTKNEIKLNAMLAGGLLDSHFYNNATEKHFLFIAGVGDVPVEIDRGVGIDRHDLCSSHEQADIHITQHALALGLLGKSVNVVCDDTDVFVLLVHFYNSQIKASNPPPPQCSCSGWYSCHCRSSPWYSSWSSGDSLVQTLQLRCMA